MTDGSICGIVLASGESKRFGPTNKLTALVGGTSVIRRTVNAYVSALESVFVVLGHEAEEIERALRDMSVLIVPNPDYRTGQASSLRRGVEALPSSASAAVIGVGDQPLLTPSVIVRLVSVHNLARAPIVAPTYSGRRGNPVLFVARLFSELSDVQGDVGGRALFATHPIELAPIEDSWAGMDIDQPSDLVTVERRLATMGAESP